MILSGNVSGKLILYLVYKQSICYPDPDLHKINQKFQDKTFGGMVESLRGGEGMAGLNETVAS